MAACDFHEANGATGSKVTIRGGYPKGIWYVELFGPNGHREAHGMVQEVGRDR